MSKQFPEMIVLKHHKCPDCGERLGRPVLKIVEDSVQAGCRNQDCSFTVDLFWIGDQRRRVN